MTERKYGLEKRAYSFSYAHSKGPCRKRDNKEVPRIIKQTVFAYTDPEAFNFAKKARVIGPCGHKYNKV